MNDENKGADRRLMTKNQLGWSKADDNKAKRWSYQLRLTAKADENKAKRWSSAKADSWGW